MRKSDLSYWRWLVCNSPRAGYQRFLDWWLLVHLAIGVLLAVAVRTSLVSCANSVLLPLVGILIGLTFAWGGNAQALLQSKEVGMLAEHRPGGLREYVFAYQTAILAVMATLVLWAVAGLGIFDGRWPRIRTGHAYLLVKTALFSMSSLTLRECWHVVLSAQWLLLAQHELKTLTGEDGPPEPEDATTK